MGPISKKKFSPSKSGLSLSWGCEGVIKIILGRGPGLSIWSKFLGKSRVNFVEFINISPLLLGRYYIQRFRSRGKNFQVAGNFLDTGKYLNIIISTYYEYCIFARAPRKSGPLPPD